MKKLESPCQLQALYCELHYNSQGIGLKNKYSVWRKKLLILMRVMTHRLVMFLMNAALHVKVFLGKMSYSCQLQALYCGLHYNSQGIGLKNKYSVWGKKLLIPDACDDPSSGHVLNECSTAR